MADDVEEVEDGEVVDGLPVVTDSGIVEERAIVALPAVQVAALAATGFVAGACTVAMVSHRRSKKQARRRKKVGPIGEIMSSNSFLIDVHLLRRD